MGLTDLLVPTFRQMLKSLSDWLKKAETQLPEVDAETLLSSRLASDMYPLATQVRFACVQAQEAIFRLRGEALPESIHELLQEGRNADEHPGSLSDAQSRIGETIALLDSLPPEALDAYLDEPVVLELPNGIVFDLTAEQYARDWTLAQFYFHLMTAYSILRSEQVDLGKTDYVPHMFSYVRPGNRA